MGSPKSGIYIQLLFPLLSHPVHPSAVFGGEGGRCHGPFVYKGKKRNPDLPPWLCPLKISG